VVAALAGPAVAVALAAGGLQIPPVTIGSTTGTPSRNICSAGIDCTYVPYDGVNPELQVPVSGTVQSFSINTGSSSGTVVLRVLRPTSGGQFTAVASSPTETVATTGPETFAVTLPVQHGDVLALDNSTSALMFDTSTTTDDAWFYYPALANGSTGAPNNEQVQRRLLVSATILPTPTSQSSTSSSTPTTSAPPSALTLTHVGQTHRVWRRGSRLATVTAKRPPIGTTFTFDLSKPATVTFVFTRRPSGHKRSRRRPATMTIAAATGADKVTFAGRVSRRKKLPPGSYEVSVTAADATGQRAGPAVLKFRIAP